MSYKQLYNKNFLLVVFFVYQLFSVLLIAIGVWPQSIVYVNLGLQVLLALVLDSEYGLYSIILSLPFYLAVPNSKFDSLSSWRIAFAAVFLKFLYVSWKQGKLRQIRYFEWDRFLFPLLLLIIISIFGEQFKTIGLKKLLFVINIYLIYILALNTVVSRQSLLRAIKYTFASLATIVLLGYVQFGATFSTSTYYFWQYWATMISKVYYGQGLSNTLIYSNSWFSFAAGQAPSLRMFSVLPDSHAFAVVALFSIPFAASLIYFAQKRWQKIWLWVYIALASLALVLSGTRGVWAAILAPIALLVYLYFRHQGRAMAKKLSIPIILFFVFILISPLVQRLTYYIQNKNSGNFLTRAESIYDLQESSNKGRLEIWVQTLKYSAQHPLLGTGFGDFIVSLEDHPVGSYDQLAQEKDQRFNLPKQYITAHDLYLDLLAETGFIGLAFFLIYMWDVFKAFWKYFKSHYLYSEDGYAFFAVNVGLYVVWLFAYLVFDATIFNDRVLTYYFIMLALAANIMKDGSKHVQSQN